MPYANGIFQQSGLNAEHIKCMEAALERAWHTMTIADKAISSGMLAATARELLARHIVQEVRNGITDTDELAKRAVSRLQL
jgi:hypothetical protein